MQTTFSTKFVVHTSKLKDGLVPVFLPDYSWWKKSGVLDQEKGTLSELG